MSKDGRKRGKIQREVVTAILLVGIIPGILVVLIAYLSGINALKNSIGANFQEMAKETADKIEIIMNREIQDAQSLALSPYIKDAVIMANQAYERKGQKEILRRGVDEIQDFLKDYQRQRMIEYGSILITDIKGEIIAATNNPVDYSQGGNGWWHVTFNQGIGRIFISGIEYDDVAQIYAVAIAVPIMDQNNKEAIGVLKTVHDVKDIFKVITNIKIGYSGHANLVTSDGTLVVCPIFPPSSHRINDQLMRQINTDSPGWGVAFDDAHGGRNSIIGFAPVISTFKMGPDNFGGKSWYIFVRQLPEETYAPIYALMWKESFLGLAFIVVLSLLGFYTARKIVRPIGLLTEGAKLIGYGRLDHRISIKTNDEIEQLAETFNQMTDNLEKSVNERERYLHQIEESEGRYKTLFDYAADSMLMADLEGRIVAVNKREEEVIGYSKDTLIGQGLSLILPEEDRETFNNLFERIFRGEEVSTTEVKVLSQGRGLLTMEMDLTGLRRGERITFVQIHLRDITERKILEEEIKLERDKLETIIESMGDGLDIVNKDFRIQYMNEKFLRLFGKEAIGRSCYEVYMGRKKPCDECPVVKGIEKIGILEVNTPQGQTFLITHSPFKNLDGTISILEIFKDITTRKKLELAIKVSEERYRTLFDHAADSMLMVDLKGRVAAVNEREEEVIGYSKDTLVGQEFSLILCEEDREVFTDLFRSKLDGEDVPTTEVKVLSQGHGLLTMEMDLTGITRGEGFTFVQIHLRDITKSKELELQLLRSERLTALTHFSSTLVHDLRNPIIGIKKRLEGLQSTLETSSAEKIQRILIDAISGSGLLIGMVNDVLDVYQNSYEELPLIISNVTLIEAIEEAVKLLQVEVEEKDICVSLHDEYKLLSIQGDRRRLQRVFINLLDNAIKYSPIGGKIEISFKPVVADGVDWILLAVEDEGPGIPPSELTSIFELFHRKNGRKDRKTGTGLGLYFCTVVVEAHQGKIWAANRAGKGAAFYIQIPMGEREVVH